MWFRAMEISIGRPDTSRVTRNSNSLPLLETQILVIRHFHKYEGIYFHQGNWNGVDKALTPPHSLLVHKCSLSTGGFITDHTRAFHIPHRRPGCIFFSTGTLDFPVKWQMLCNFSPYLLHDDVSQFSLNTFWYCIQCELMLVNQLTKGIICIVTKIVLQGDKCILAH